MKDLPKKAQGIVTALAAQIQQQDAKIQEQASEIKYKTTIEHGWMQVEREKTNEKLKADTANNQTKQIDTHVKATTSMHVAEIKAGAQLLNTHTEAAHNKAAAADALKAAEQAEASEKEPDIRAGAGLTLCYRAWIQGVRFYRKVPCWYVLPTR